MKPPRLLLAALLLGLVIVPELRAQVPVTGSTLQINDTATFGLAPDPGTFEWRDNGILISKGTVGQGALLPGDQGMGARLLWYPGKAAFRVGRVIDYGTGTTWDETNIGLDSIALGKNSQASGGDSVALAGGIATAWGSFAAGGGMGNTAAGQSSVSLGGHLNLASGLGSVTIGGWGNTSTGGYGFSSGVSNTASGSFSATFGQGNRAESLHSFVIGRYNVGGFAPTGNTIWIATDPIFEIGNGVGGAPPFWTPTRSNALTVYKNGNATFQGVVQVAPGGDIPMYTGN